MAQISDASHGEAPRRALPPPVAFVMTGMYCATPERYAFFAVFTPVGKAIFKDVAVAFLLVGGGEMGNNQRSKGEDPFR